MQVAVVEGLSQMDTLASGWLWPRSTCQYGFVCRFVVAELAVDVRPSIALLAGDPVDDSVAAVPGR